MCVCVVEGLGQRCRHANTRTLTCTHAHSHAHTHAHKCDGNCAFGVFLQIWVKAEKAIAEERGMRRARMGAFLEGAKQRVGLVQGGAKAYSPKRSHSLPCNIALLPMPAISPFAS